MGWDREFRLVNLTPELELELELVYPRGIAVLALPRGGGPSEGPVRDSRRGASMYIRSSLMSSGGSPRSVGGNGARATVPRNGWPQQIDKPIHRENRREIGRGRFFDRRKKRRFFIEAGNRSTPAAFEMLLVILVGLQSLRILPCEGKKVAPITWLPDRVLEITVMRRGDKPGPWALLRRPYIFSQKSAFVASDAVPFRICQGQEGVAYSPHPKKIHKVPPKKIMLDDRMDAKSQQIQYKMGEQSGA